MLATNSILQGRYRILRLLGAGGMGAVYEAIDQRLDCLVALKEATVDKDDARSAFQREASLLANLRYRSLPNVMDHFSEGDGQFLVMQYIPGDDLGKLLASSRPFAVDEVLRWAEVLLNTLEYLHGLNPPILHRDIKPSNLKLTGNGELFLLDFGLAKGSVGQMETVTKTVQSVFGYTPFYGPLEQILGGGTEARSDLYSLGATLYHLLSGNEPVDARLRLQAERNDEVDPLRPVHELNREVSRAVSSVIAQAMEMKVRDRPASAAAMREAFRAAIENPDLEAEQKPKVLSVPDSRTGTSNPEKSSSQSKRWDEASFFPAMVEQRGQVEADVAKRILDWCKAHFSRIKWGRGNQYGSFIPILDSRSSPCYTIVVSTYGRVEIQFQYMTVPPFDREKKRVELLSRLNQIPGVSLPADGIRRRPSIPLSTLQNDQVLNILFESLAWAVSEVKTAEHSGPK